MAGGVNFDVSLGHLGVSPFSFTVTKGSAPSSVTCSISESTPQFTLTGMVTGSIVTTG